MRKNMKKIISTFLFALVMILNLSNIVSADTIDNSNDDGFNYILEQFPDLKKELKDNGYNEIVSKEDTYLKIQLKDISNEKEVYEPEDFVITEVDSSEFYRAKLEEDVNLDSKATFASRSQNYFEKLGGNSYLQLSLCVIRNSSKTYKFTVNHNYNWIKKPLFNFTDAIGINVGPTMKINTNTYKSQSIRTYKYEDLTQASGYSYNTEVIDNTNIPHSNIGIATKFDLRAAAQYQSGYITCEAEFTQPALGYQTANVFGNYIHTKAGFNGGLSLDNQGKPSISVNLIEEEYSVPVDVDYQP